MRSPPTTPARRAAISARTIKLAPVQVPLGSLSVVVTPQLRWFVQTKVNTHQFVTVEVSQTFSASGSLTNNGGKYTTHGAASTSHVANVTGAPTSAPSANAVSVSIGPAVTMGLFGRSGPTVKVGLGAALNTSANAAPWWTADATQQVTGTAGAPGVFP